MDFIEFLTSKNQKYCELKLKQAVYDSNKGLELQLLFPDKYGIMQEEDKQMILDFANEYVENKFNVEIKYKKSYVDNEVVWFFTEKFFQEHLKYADTILKKDNIKVKPTDAENVELKQNVNFDCFNIVITMTKSLFETFEQQNLVQRLNEYLQQNICANFSITLDPCLSEIDLQAVLKSNDNHQTELSMLRDVSIPEEEKYYSFELQENLIGEIPENYALRLDQLKTESEKNIIAGTLKFMNEKRFPDKRDETKERVLYALMLEDYWGKMRCVYFPNQNTMETIQKLQEGDQLAIMGDYESYNGNFSFKVNAIAYAKLGEKPEEKIKWRQPFDEYLVVQPQEYIEMSQMNLLDNEEEEVSQFLKDNDIVVFDFETTGLNVDDSYILELGAVKIHNGKLTETFSALVKPPVKIPPEITELTHITEEMVANAPTYELVLADFYKFTRGCILSAYNIEFDAKFLDKYGRSILFNFDNEQIDTLVLARQKIKGLPNYKLKTVVTHLGISLESAHRALDDAVATAKVFQKLS